MSKIYRLLVVLVALAALLTCAPGVGAQEETPTPWPTPIVTDTYIVRQEVTYGDGGIIVALLFLAGVVLLQLFVHLGERITDR